MNCRHCGTPLEHRVLDLGFSPPSNGYLRQEDLKKPEITYPLRLFVCTSCWLVQTEDYAKANELFNPDYAYFSSTSASWLRHAELYSEAVIEHFNLGSDSFVIEIAANDGYLLQNFVAARIPCLGIEPTASTAEAAEAKGIPILREFFGATLGKDLAAEGRQADLVIGNNVYAHVPDINDFTRGLKAALKPGGTITLEFPHLMLLLEQALFDTVYHEHYSYLSLASVEHIFAAAGLRVFDLERLPTHGGSLRVYGCHADDERAASAAVANLLAQERERGMADLTLYQTLQPRADRVKDDLVMFLIEQKRQGKLVAGYGAAAKGNTLLNYAGVKPDLLPFVCDAAPSKQGKYLPGSHVPILPPAVLSERRPDFLLILPWNIAAEIKQQNAWLAGSGTQFVTAVPKLAAA